MKQHTKPLFISKGQSSTLNRIPYGTLSYDENWLQDLCFKNAALLPIDEIEPVFGGMIPICKELSLPAGSADLVYLNEYGFISIGECKLWRNPQARREIIGQILDYAKDLVSMDYCEFEERCLKARGGDYGSLVELMQASFPELDEAKFIDATTKNLQRGRFVLVIIGDGIRENAEELVSFVQDYSHAEFTLALVELPVFSNPANDDLIITPRLLVKTKQIERTVYRDSRETHYEEGKPKSTSISESEFYRRLEKTAGKEESRRLEKFVSTLCKEIDLQPVLGRGKKISLNLKSADGTYNFASIQDDGQVWFYGLVNKTEEAGDSSVGVNYLKKLASLIDGEFVDSTTKWSWSVKKEGQYAQIGEYLRHAEKWIGLIKDTLEKIYLMQEG